MGVRCKLFIDTRIAGQVRAVGKVQTREIATGTGSVKLAANIKEVAKKVD